MRSNMAKVIVERPRRNRHSGRRGRPVALDDLPSHEGMRRAQALRGDRKELNENLQPLRRYLERQVGRPWRKVYGEIAKNLRVDSTVQQHVRDHLGDFVAIKPRRIKSWKGRMDPWWQPFYVDPATGLLCRTDRLPEVKARRRAERNRPPAPVTRVAIGKDSELRLVAGLWYHVRLAPLAEPIYQVSRDIQKRFRNGYSARRGVDEVEVDVRRLVTPGVRDAVTGELIPAGPAIDDTAGWTLYRRDHPTRLYAVAKRALSRRELRRHSLCNSPPEES
jgi:hypothetical protein